MTLHHPQKYPMTVTIIVDGNRHFKDHLKTINAPEGTPHLPHPIRTSLDMPISLRKCRKIVERLKEAYGIQAKHLQIHLLDKEWEDTFGGFDIDGNPNKRSYAEYKQGADNHKTAEYNVDTNTLTIYQNNMPVYENANGVITNDPEALADCQGD